MPIARTWSGATRVADADRYLEYLGRTGLRDLAGTPGNEGVLALRRVEGDRAEFTVVSLWRDERVVECFSGVPIDRAVFYPEDADYLVERDETVRHHEVLVVGPTVARRGALGRLLARMFDWWASWARRAIPAPGTRDRRA
ncbi:MAG: hypothetical protein ACODAA_03350 [Gemmatimonadota bacterium]